MLAAGSPAAVSGQEAGLALAMTTRPPVTWPRRTGQRPAGPRISRHRLPAWTTWRCRSRNWTSPLRAYNSLRREGIHTIGDLVARTPRQLLSIENIGPASVEEIRQRLAARGLGLSESAGSADGAEAESGGPATGAARPRPRAPAGRPQARHRRLRLPRCGRYRRQARPGSRLRTTPSTCSAWPACRFSSEPSRWQAASCCSSCCWGCGDGAAPAGRAIRDRCSGLACAPPADRDLPRRCRRAASRWLRHPGALRPAPRTASPRLACAFPAGSVAAPLAGEALRCMAACCAGRLPDPAPRVHPSVSASLVRVGT